MKLTNFILPILMGNNPILFSDADGRRIVINGYVFVPGQAYNGKDLFVAGTVKALNRLIAAEKYMAENSIGLGENIVSTLAERTDFDINIKEKGFRRPSYRPDGNNGTVHFNLETALRVADNNDMLTGGNIYSDIVLVHELSHGYNDKVLGTYGDNFDTDTFDFYQKLEEKIAVFRERSYVDTINKLFNQMNSMRFNYNKGDLFKSEGGPRYRTTPQPNMD
jgi:hypothetical protein